MKRLMQPLAQALTLALVASTGVLFSPSAAQADGAASTRNIIFGAAAVGAGTLLIINHNKKVHEKYAEYDRQQAATQAQANQSQAAYESEREAYDHETSINAEYRKETNYQHAQVVQRDREIVALKHSLQIAKSGATRSSSTFVQQTAVTRPTVRAASLNSSTQAARIASYGWGQY